MQMLSAFLQAQQQQQQQFMQAMLSQQQALTALMQSIPQQQQQPSQALLAAQMLSLSTLGQLKPFDGKAGPTGLALQEWLTHAELYFMARENAMGITATEGDAHRISAARAALTDDALRWLSSLPSPLPATWASFRLAMKKRFDSVSSAQVREATLQRFVEAARRVREKLNVEGIQKYTTLFLQHASQLDSGRVTEASKRILYAQGLPARYAEMVLTEDAKDNPPPLHEVAQTVLAKATMKAHANSGGLPQAAADDPSPSPTSDSMEIDSIRLCAAQFGIPLAEIGRLLASQGSMHTHARGNAANTLPSTAGPSSSGGRSSTSEEISPAERLLAAFEARYGKSSSSSGQSQSSRRNTPNDSSDEVPQELADDRKEAGLCIRCGVTNYEPGSRGHNARTCTLPVNKVLSAAEGRKQANS